MKISSNKMFESFYNIVLVAISVTPPNINFMYEINFISGYPFYQDKYVSDLY